MSPVVFFVFTFIALCSCWDTPLPQVAIAGSQPVNFDSLYVLCENQANTNASGSRDGRIGTQVVIAAAQPSRILALEIRMYTIKTADVWHTHAPYEILCVSEGNGVFTSATGEQWQMAPGDCTLMTESTSHYFQSYDTSSTSNFTVLVNTFLPAPFQRTDNLTAEQTWTYPTTPLRTTFQQGTLGLSGQASKVLSSYSASTPLFSNSDFNISLVVAKSGQVLNSASLPVDSNIFVQKGTLNINAGGVSYVLHPGDFFVLPSNVAATGSATADLSLLVFSSPPTSQLLTFTDASSTSTTTGSSSSASTIASLSSLIISIVVAFVALVL